MRAGLVFAILAATGFSLKSVIVKYAYAWQVDPITFLTLRNFFALPLLLWVALREWPLQAGRPLSRRGWLAIGVLGILGGYLSGIADYTGLRYISAALERLVLFTYPTFTLILGALFLGQRIGWREVGTCVLCYLGIAAAFVQDLRGGTDTATVWTGGAYVLCAAMTYAMYLTGTNRMVSVVRPALLTVLTLLVAVGAMLLHFTFTRPWSGMLQPWPVYAYAFLVAWFCTVLPSMALSAAIHRIGSGRSALIGTLGPPFTIALGWVTLGDPFSWWQLAGCGLVLAGVLLIGRSR
ncbi:MAG: DMT family transporter [Proteobacteria bacterium]|nr:DMT family transporter [Pseudomonadota bacterium]